jgi:hypothetical protein
VGPCILHGDAVITNANAYRENAGAYKLLDGSPIAIQDPVTGQRVAWKFQRTYGCSTAVASQYLLTFRSGAAGFYDLLTYGGTGNFGGFKSSCTANLIVANGVLNAPEYTRSCSCGYQNQTSLALVPMPSNEIWTYSLLGRSPRGSPSVQRIGINFGAPGDRMARDGTLWANYPADIGPSPAIAVTLEGEVKWFRNHSSRVSSGDLPWVVASGAEGLRKLRVNLKPRSGRTAPSRSSADAPALQHRFTVRLYFAEPDAKVQTGQRVCDVAIQGKTVLTGLDIVAEAGGPLRTVMHELLSVPADDVLEINLNPRSTREPVLCGLEIVRLKE